MITYKSAGVDVSRIKKSQSAIGRIISSTHSGMVKSGFGHYAGLVGIHGGKYLATHTDGVGTKVIIANLLKKYDTVGIDCVAMNVNDIICIGATPISFVDYIAANKNNESVFVDIAKGLAVGAKKSDMPIVGGETAIMPDLFEEKKFAFDLAGMVAGIVDKNKVIMGNKIKPGDIIIGLASTGIHSNGYSLARKVLLKKYSINDTIVIFDRIRENSSGKNSHSFTEIINISINQTLGRTINTSLATLISVIAIILGGATELYDFSIVLIFGIFIGTYSSIFIAAPFVEIYDSFVKKA
ncbi:MAG: phosphoribosylformylglycinamidine cyclo-ligase [Nitrosopumilaceae archaeon]|nr:phosphoribosylformylglycinamidine cyclo-ligase [Nitrosopumilaceae archaeon]